MMFISPPSGNVLFYFNNSNIFLYVEVEKTEIPCAGQLVD